MTNKPQKQDLSLEDKKKILAESGIIVGAVLLLCYFFGFSYIWNTGYGSEASANGWNYIFALITNNYKGTGALYGDIAVPFNYYAKIYVRVLAVFVFVSFIILIAFIISSCLNIKTFNKKLETLTIVILYVLAAVFLGCIITALTMNGSKILPKFCSSNPQCSIATLAFFPFFITLGTAIGHTIFVYKNEL